jgi:cyclic dehypoxanthinyl futalosine synthase
MRTSVTMMYGMGESAADRVEHLVKIRDLQARTGGFTAFICWPLQPEGTPMFDGWAKTDAVTYLRILALGRIICRNIPNMQSSWVTMGHKVGQIALRFGANDYGSLMMEENVVSAAGTTHRATLQEMERIITDAGFTPRRRRQDYTLIEEPAVAA